MSFSTRDLFAILFVILTLTVFLCEPLRISAASALKADLNAENAEGRRGTQRNSKAPGASVSVESRSKTKVRRE
jgi:hypothetical protein